MAMLLLFPEGAKRRKITHTLATCGTLLDITQNVCGKNDRIKNLLLLKWVVPSRWQCVLEVGVSKCIGENVCQWIEQQINLQLNDFPPWEVIIQFHGSPQLANVSYWQEMFSEAPTKYFNKKKAAFCIALKAAGLEHTLKKLYWNFQNDLLLYGESLSKMPSYNVGTWDNTWNKNLSAVEIGQHLHRQLLSNPFARMILPEYLHYRDTLRSRMFTNKQPLYVDVILSNV